MSERDGQRGLLLDALLNTEELVRKYHHQADFHHAINLMVGALPQHVEAMAKASDEAEMLRKKMIENISSSPAPHQRWGGERPHP